MLPPGLAPEISYKIFHAPPFLLHLPVECQCSGLPGKPYVEDGGAPAPRTLLFTADTCQPFGLGHICVLSHCSLGLAASS